VAAPARRVPSGGSGRSHHAPTWGLLAGRRLLVNCGLRHGFRKDAVPHSMLVVAIFGRGPIDPLKRARCFADWAQKTEPRPTTGARRTDRPLMVRGVGSPNSRARGKSPALPS
jgi:hypothetical protein